MKLSNKPLAMAYVPWQPFENVMDGNCGLAQGSIFEDLIFPFIGAQAACQANVNNRQGNYSGNYPRGNNMSRSQQSQNYSNGRRCGY